MLGRRVPGFHHVPKNLATVDRVQEDLHVREAREDDADRVRQGFQSLPQEVDAGHVRHSLVGNDHSDVAFLLDKLKSFPAAAGNQDGIPVDEGTLQLLQIGHFIVDDKDLVLLIQRDHRLCPHARAPGESSPAKPEYVRNHT